MHSVVHEVPQTREERLDRTLNAYYVAPFASALRNPTGNVSELALNTSSRRNTSASLPPSLISSFAVAFDKPMENDGPGLRRILLPAPPSEGFPHRMAPRSRRRQRDAAIEASASAAASQTLQRQRQQQQRTISCSPRRAGSGILFEVCKPPHHRSDATVSAETPTARKKTIVTSPHAATSTTLTAQPRPSPLDNTFVNNRNSSGNDSAQKKAAKLAWRLRRRSEVPPNASDAFAGPSSLSNLLDRKKNPLDVLRYLGSATFNDAPLHTFLPDLDLRLPSSRSSAGAFTSLTEAYVRDAGTPSPNVPATTAAAAAEQSRWHTIRDSDRRRRRSGRQRTDVVAVHLGDVEARTFRIDVVPNEASPLQSLVDAYRGCSWDGMEFLLLPLGDEPRVPLNAAKSPPYLARDLPFPQHDSDSVATNGTQTASLSFSQESQTGLKLPEVPITFLRSANNSFAPPSMGGEDNEPPDGPSVSPSAGEGGNAVLGRPVLVRAAGMAAAGDGDTGKSVVPCWKRFSTAAALYLTLGDAGCCDITQFPYPAVQLCTWGDLVAQQQTRIEMMASGTATALRALQIGSSDRKSEPIPVAVLFPTTRKGIMRRSLSLTTQPFSDAEVFQLFYLQLVFRAYFDVRFPALGFRLPGRAEWCLRSDFVATRSSGGHGVAFEHPHHRDAWLRFPTHTRLLTLLCLKEAVIPLYATPAELQETAVLPLFGAGDALPCIGAVGHAVAQWAATVEVASPASAMAALTTLFEKMDTHYGITRAELWQGSSPGRFVGAAAAAKEAAPLFFRCGVTSVGAALDRHSGTLARVFVPPEKRGVSVSRTDGRTTSVDVSLTLSGTVRQTHLPCIPHDSSGAVTMLPSTVATPHQIALNAVVLDLNTSDALRNSWTTDVFNSTAAASPVLIQSRTTVFANALDVVHVSATQVPDDNDDAAAAALDASKLLCTAASSATADADAGADVAGGTPVPPSRLVSAPSSSITNEEKANPLLSASTEALKAVEGHDSAADAGAAVSPPLRSFSFVGASSPFTKQESLVSRWRFYMESGNCAIFNGGTAGIRLYELLGRGGSGLVYRGTYGSRHLPVAVKVLIIPDGMSQERYVRESLTDVAFYVLANQLNDFGISYNGRAHDFIVSSVAPAGLPAADAAEARRGGDPATTKLCYFVTDLMDGTIGRFLDASDADFDPMYDQLLNSSLQECELFQFLFNQLAFKTLFDWRVLDLMLNNQLRGDNIGFRYVSLPPEQAVQLREHPEKAATTALARQYYAGLLYAFQFSPEEHVRYLRFPAAQNSVSSTGEKVKGDETPLRVICMIDVGQGTQPNVEELVRNGHIGETVVASCVEDDGFGRFWPLDELYCRYVDVKGAFSKDVVEWGSKLRIHSQEDALHALQELFVRYYATFGVETPTEEELRTYLCFSWTPSNVADLRKAYVYRAE